MSVVRQPNAESNRSSTTVRKWRTIPNLLCAVRLVGAPGLVALALLQQPGAFVCWFLFLSLTDWLDGKLAVLLDQRSEIGPKLDTVSDVAMYACLLFGCVWLKYAFFWSESAWVGAAVVSYIVTVAIALFKFRSWPSYHTRAAKFSWLLMVAAVVAVLLDWSAWPFRVAMAAVTITNLETALMSLLLRRPQSDVPTIRHALRRY